MERSSEEIYDFYYKKAIDNGYSKGVARRFAEVSLEKELKVRARSSHHTNPRPPRILEQVVRTPEWLIERDEI